MKEQLLQNCCAANDIATRSGLAHSLALENNYMPVYYSRFFPAFPSDPWLVAMILMIALSITDAFAPTVARSTPVVFSCVCFFLACVALATIGRWHLLRLLDARGTAAVELRSFVDIAAPAWKADEHPQSFVSLGGHNDRVVYLAVIMLASFSATAFGLSRVAANGALGAVVTVWLISHWVGRRVVRLVPSEIIIDEYSGLHKVQSVRHSIKCAHVTVTPASGAVDLHDSDGKCVLRLYAGDFAWPLRFIVGLRAMQAGACESDSWNPTSSCKPNCADE